MPADQLTKRGARAPQSALPHIEEEGPLHDEELRVDRDDIRMTGDGSGDGSMLEERAQESHGGESGQEHHGVAPRGDGTRRRFGESDGGRHRDLVWDGDEALAIPSIHEEPESYGRNQRGRRIWSRRAPSRGSDLRPARAGSY